MSYSHYYNSFRGRKSHGHNAPPRQRMKFGQTWWGEQWLNSLTKIDYANRLPRGRAYASNGAVLTTEIIINQIFAKVSGSRPKPYTINITIPLFNPEQKESLVEAIRQDPFILSKLLNRELPNELNQMAKDMEIKLFPSSWKDFSMTCSCPDWAVPCKHLAAVIYMISREIDSNPFLVLKMHGLDLMEELKDTIKGISSHENETILQVESMISGQIPGLEASPDFSLEALPDFSVISADSDSILTLLSASPLFYTGNFRTILQTNYTHLEKGLNKYSPPELSEKIGEITDKICFSEKTLILINPDLSVITVLFSADENENKDILISFEELVNLLENLDQVKLSVSNTALRGIEIHRQYALALAKSGSIIPQLLKNTGDEFLIRWIPAVNDPVIRRITPEVQQYAMPGTVRMRNLDKKKKENYFPLSAEENSLTIVSLFLGYYLKMFFRNSESKNISSQKITEMFFQGKPAIFSEPGEKHAANTIQLWLKRLHLAKKKWTPLLHLEENGWFQIHFPVVNREEPTQAPVSLSDFISGAEFELFRYDVLRDLTTLADFLPDIAYYIKTKGHHPIRFDPNSFLPVLTRIIPVLRLLGIETMMPKSLEKLLSPALTLKITTTPGVKNPSFFSMEHLLGFEYQVAIGDTLMPAEEFRNLVGKLSGIVKIKDQYVFISNDHLKKLLDQLDKPIRMNQQELLKSALSQEYRGSKAELTPQVIAMISELTKSREIGLPENLTATLRPYQVAGYRWMVRNSQVGFGSLLADDMGLGKTVQVIATMLKFKYDGKFENEKGLIIVPTTLLTNWEKEIMKFAPSLKTFIYHGQDRIFKRDNYDLLLTSYGILRSDLKIFKPLKWSLIVIDEAQNIKNPGTEQSKAVKSLATGFRIAMSGTPVENRLTEYRSIMDFLNPGYLGSEKAFNEEFAKPIQMYHDQNKAAVFRKITAPFILRRLKSDKTIITDLPEKIENDHYCTLTPEQAAIYQNIVNNALSEIAGLEGIQRRGLVLKMITALKQICNHPDNLLKKGNALPDRSGKSIILTDLLEQIRECGEKVLIFTQYKEMGDILARMIHQRFSAEPLFLHGGTSRKQRDFMVEEFQNRNNRWVFILSLKAGGTGLNLTGASHVVHYDMWWNPAVEAQATDRAYRIGQDKNVMVNRLITKGTFEEKINEMLMNKKTLANLTVETGEKWIGDLNDKELKEIFMLGNTGA